jgi:FKBP-type peptidyl-prolyl cis-trans isomerase 2
MHEKRGDMGHRNISHLFTNIRTLFLITVLSLFVAGAWKPADAADPLPVPMGDLVTFRVTAKLPDGSLVYTTEEQEASKDGVKKAAGYMQSECFLPLEILEGEEGPIPGLRDALTGMQAGGKRTVTLPAEKAYGAVDKNLIKQFDCAKTMKKLTTMDPKEYFVRFNAFPVVGAEVSLNPYFRSRVKKVGPQKAVLENLARDGRHTESAIGRTDIRVKGNEISIVLKPAIGADFEVAGKKGKIVSTDGKTFSVDLNPPLAGKELVLDLEVTSRTSADSLKTMDIPWTEDYMAGLSAGKNDQKPVVLVLYASWCQWSKKYLEETFADPRIKAMKDRFIWVKIDSDQNKQYKTLYQQEGFPLTVLLNPDGTVMKKISGFNNASRLQQELLCASKGRVSKVTTGDVDAPQQPEQGCTSEQ